MTIHEAPITQSGWTGAGYTTIDPQTGAGGYMIEGGSNGGVYLVAAFIFAILALAILAWLGPFAILGYGWMLTASFASAGAYLNAIGAEVNVSKVIDIIGAFLAIIAFIPLGITLTPAAAMFAATIGLLFALRSAYLAII